MIFGLLLSLSCVQAESPTAPTTEPTATTSQLRWVELTTGGASKTEALPLFIAVHGLGDKPENFISLFNKISCRARVIAPAAPIAYHDGGSWFNTRVADAQPQMQSEEALAATAELAHWIDAISAQKNTLSKPIITGFSQGGLMSYSVAVHYPASVSLAIPISGWLPSPMRPNSSPSTPIPPIRALHGTSDNIVDMSLPKEAVSQLEAQGVDVQLKSFPGARHQITAEMYTYWQELVETQCQAIHKEAK